MINLAITQPSGWSVYVPVPSAPLVTINLYPLGSDGFAMFAIPVTRKISLFASSLSPVMTLPPVPMVSGDDAFALSRKTRSPTLKSPTVG